MILIGLTFVGVLTGRCVESVLVPVGGRRGR